MKQKWLAIFTTVSLLVPTSALANVDGNNLSKNIIRAEIGGQEMSADSQFQFLKENGILKGKADGKAHLEAKLTRAELAVSLYRLYKLEKPTEKIAPYQDTTKHWAKDEIQAVTAKGWMSADQDRKFYPNKSMTVAEVAEIFEKASGKDGIFYGKASDSSTSAKRSHLVINLYEAYHYQQSNTGIWAGNLEPKLVIEPLSVDDFKWTFTVKNQTEREQKVNISASQFDYILKKNGQKLEQYTDNKKWIMIYREKILKQGEELTFTGEFTDLTKGKYELEIWLIDQAWPNAKATIQFEVK